MTIKALNHALQVLRCFDSRRPEWSVSELVRRTGLSKSHVHKVLKEFLAADYLVQDPVSRRYRPGPRAFLLGAGFTTGTELVQIAAPLVHELATSTGAICGFSIPCRKQSLFVLMSSGDPGLRPNLLPGSYTPLHATSAGKLRAAFLPDCDQQTLLKSAAFRAVTLRTIVHRPILEKQLQNARKTGLAFTFGESTSSLAGISAAVVDETKEYAGAVTLLSPYQRDYNVIDRRLLSHVKQTAARIARALGAEPYPYPQI